MAQTNIIDDAFLGIELGSTRIKSVLVDENGKVLAVGTNTWENKFQDGYWTYSLDDVWTGLRRSYSAMCADVAARFGVRVSRLRGIGISAMMHGYMVFDKTGKQLVPFRTWRNSTAAEASNRLSELFDFNIPQRWSIAHLYQAILNGEQHVKDIDFITTLAGYVHWQLTGMRVVGLGEGSGILPLSSDKCYDGEMISHFQSLAEVRQMPWQLADILPSLLSAGECAGFLTERGAKLLDESGLLHAGIPFCPPEGDVQTGMVATNSITERRGNVSAGTSVFAVFVPSEPVTEFQREIDVTVTPVGKQAVMVHCNNCSGDIDSWANMFDEFAKSAGVDLSKDELYRLLFRAALNGQPDCAGLVAYNFLSGEHILGYPDGRLLFARRPDSKLTLSDFMRANIYSAFCVLKKGVDMLKKDNVRMDKIVAHGGLFKVDGVAQQLLADALDTCVAVSNTAGEGGAWGMALLAAYMSRKDVDLESYLDKTVFCSRRETVVSPDPEGARGFEKYYERYIRCLSVEEEAVRRL